MKKKVKKLTERFTLLKDGWIKDSKTGLEWGNSSPNEMELKDAKKYCVTQGGRLPSRGLTVSDGYLIKLC